jgi:hypothetical protein
MAEAVYLVSAAASIACAWMLFRAYLRSHMRLLLWSSLCFGGLCVNNVLLFIDLVLIPDIDIGLVPIRLAVALGGLVLLLYGLIWDAS